MNDASARSPADERRALLRVAEVAETMGVSPRVVYQWLASGVIPHEVMVRAGRAVYIKRRALETWLAGRDSGEPPASTG